MNLNQAVSGMNRLLSGADGRFIGTNDENVDTWVYNDKWIDNTLAIWIFVPQDDAVHHMTRICRNLPLIKYL
jgi:hypothetical protein